ncbi:uncharacterized protein DDB_G0286591-like isoform X2 [Actinia tenebrosa]|nr:uncharacterized protein DDB_G0286591-like isoform X2 [Actinia tenebrosa]
MNSKVGGNSRFSSDTHNTAIESQSTPKTDKNRHQETTVHSQLNRKKHHTVILPGVKFGLLSQEVPGASPPNEEMQHRMRMRMKRKKRRRLRALKRISESKTDHNTQTDGLIRNPESLKTSSVEQRLTSAPKESEMKSSFSEAHTTNPASSSLRSPEKSKRNPLLSKQSKNSKKQEVFTDSYSPSSLKRPKRIPLNNDNGDTNRFSSLEITLKSKILSLNPLPKSSSTGLSSSSIDEMPAVDMLSNFFQHAGLASATTIETNRKLEQDDVRNPRNEIPKKSTQETRRPVQQKHAYIENARQEKRDQSDDDYELKLLEFQKKAIEEEEKKLKEQFGGPERQKIEVNKESRLGQLNRKNDEKEKEVQLLFEEFSKTDKQNGNNHLKPSTLEQSGNEGVDGNDSGQRRKMSKSKDDRIIKKQRTINAGGNSGNDDEITEVAFYEKQDDITNQNKNNDGLTKSKKTNDSKEWKITEGKHFETKGKISLPSNSDNDTSNILMDNNIINKTKDDQSAMSLREPVKLSADQIDRKQTQNKNEKHNSERLEDDMENEDLMESKQKQFRKKSKSKIEVDIPEEHNAELQIEKYREKERNAINTDSTESNQGKKSTDDVGVDIDVVSDDTNLPIFTEIKDKEQEVSKRINANVGKKESESLNKEKKKEMADYVDSDTEMSDNNNKSNSNNSDSNSNSSKYVDNNNNNSSKINNSKKSDSNNDGSMKLQQIIDDEDDNVMLHDNRLMYILTGEGAKPPKQKNTEPSNNREAEKIQIKQINNDVRLNNEKPLVQRQIIINKGLKSKVEEMHNRILNAHNRVSQELEQMEQELSTKFETLQKSMSMAKTLTASIDNKINNSVLSVMKLATSSAKQAKTKLDLVQKAAAALNNIEEKIGANETRNFAKKLKDKLPDLSAQKNNTYQKILAINSVITKMDGARLLALDKANTSYNSKAEIENSMSKVAGSVLDELKSTEKELSDDTEMEIEDEIEADRKIRDAKTRNYKAAVKTAQALEKIEGYLKQLENDENRLRTLEN